ncbi:MAG: hypothetical protein ACETWT_11070, partial [Thermodesulfobacteriota bacterium]
NTLSRRNLWDNEQKEKSFLGNPRLKWKALFPHPKIKFRRKILHYLLFLDLTGSGKPLKSADLVLSLDIQDLNGALTTLVDTVPQYR